jgi:DNA-binding NtrC family response regulator
MLERPLVGSRGKLGILGPSAATARLRREIARVAPFNSNVLVTGPSGTGKELVAREIHQQSPRFAQPFIPVDCASITGELMASQLFGHKAGAFTGANYDAIGCFRAADHGTIFLDEIGELTYALQAKLLRVLQEHTVTPVGSHEAVPIDVRVIAATNRDLQADVAAGRFREDLYYRLHVVNIRTAALRERSADIRALAGAFLRELAGEGLPRRSLSQDAVSLLLSYDWPGNVRQLRNVLEQAVIDSESPTISVELLQHVIPQSFALPEAERAGNTPSTSRVIARGWDTSDEAESKWQESRRSNQANNLSSSQWPTLEHVERQYILETLEHTFYNRSAAARLLGITRQSLLRKMKLYSIQPRGLNGR